MSENRIDVVVCLTPDEQIALERDAYDARVAWLLGHLWLHGDAVELVGTEQDGTFLLPRDEATSSRGV